MYDIHEESVPSDILSQFTKTSTIHNYNTRSSSNEFFQNWANEKIFCKDWYIDLELYPLFC